jgi:hypothetical protein
MIKIKLIERQTITVSESLVDSLSAFYKTNYLKLIEIYLTYNVRKEAKKKKSNNLYKIALDKFRADYSQLLTQKSPISESDFKNKLDSDLSEKIIYEIASIPSERIVPHILKQDTVLNALKSNRITTKRATKEMLAYLDSTGYKEIKILLELSKKGEDYHGLIDYESMSISVNYDIEPFEGLVLQSNVDELFKTIDRELSLTKQIVYHEFQHLFVNVVRRATGLSTFGSGPRSTTRGKLPGDNPNEVQTYAQNSVSLFNDMIGKLNIEPDQLQNTKNILLKKVLNSSLSSEEKKVYDSLDQKNIKNYIENIQNNLKLIKSYNSKFYNYALEILFSSVKGDNESADPLTVPISQRYKQDIQENLIMDKIKIVLTESQVSKEYTKEEIRKIIRDEFEKLLKDKENRKEIAKITKEFVKKFYRELSQNSTYVVDRIDV